VTRLASRRPMTRSEQMARIKSKDTRPELQLRRALWAAGLRYRLVSRLPGRPDIVIRRASLAIFVDGCFWHACPDHYRVPATNSDYWKAKRARNEARDRRVDKELQAKGWRVLRVWEHEVKDELEGVVDRIRTAVRSVPTRERSA
jgi:DNA mismatch endonuclease (patch repair protein)